MKIIDFVCNGSMLCTIIDIYYTSINCDQFIHKIYDIKISEEIIVKSEM